MASHPWTTIVFMVVGITVAEMVRGIGRIAFGFLAGMRGSHVLLGVGPELIRFRRMGSTWIWKALPLTVDVYWRPEAGASVRRRLWLFTLGGPLACIGFVLLMKAAGVPLTGDPGPLLPAQLIATMAWVMVVGRMVPISFGSDGQSPSDALQLWRLLRAPEQDVRDGLAPCARLAALDDAFHGRLAQAIAACDQGIAMFSTPWASELKLIKALALSRQSDFAGAQALAAAVLETELTSEARGLVLNDWSWYAFCRRDDGELPLADVRSLDALRLCPEPASNSVAGTRGAVLLWQRRFAEAIPLLERGYHAATGAYGKGVNACLLSMAHAARGESDKARAMFESARDVSPGEPLLVEAAQRLIDGAPTSDAPRAPVPATIPETTAPAPVRRTSSFDPARALIMTIGFLHMPALILGDGAFGSILGVGLLAISGVMILRPATPAALAFGAMILTSSVLHVGLDQGSDTANVVLIAAGVASLIAGAAIWRQPRGERDGFGLAIGAILLEAVLKGVVAFGLARRGASTTAADQVRAFIPIAAALLAVLVLGRRRGS